MLASWESGPILAAADGGALHLPVWSAAPFVLLLLSIAVLPLVAGHFWHSNRNKALVALAFSVPVVLYLLALGPATEQRSTDRLIHALEEYASFIILLAALYTVAGGLVLQGNLEGRPLTNTALLASGAVLANLIGTTGASMVLIRPFLGSNLQRRHTRHQAIFFIMVVSNLGGLLTPLGDPPLFLGFLNGVDFFWTLTLWPQWLLANGVVLAIFLVLDLRAYRREAPKDLARDIRERVPLRVRGVVNLLLLAGILAAVLLQSPQVGAVVSQWLAHVGINATVTLHKPWGEAAMLLMGVLSVLLTPARLRQANAFTWGPIVEVAVLFAGIFVTMVPALALLREHGPALGVQAPWQFFWLTGSLSSFLDNAPTYLTFATMAAGENPVGWLQHHRPLVLQAISCGAVFMGANTYVGNGPNFMVKAICDEAGFPTPSFFAYLFYTGIILLPVFALITYVFFWPT